MAGIGFNLKKLIKGDSLQSTLAAYFYTGLVTSGPWLFSVIALSLMTLWGRQIASREVIEAFMGLTIYGFAFSMILTGGSQMVITRLVSDCLYSHEEHKILGIFTGSALLTVGGAGVLGGVGVWFLGLPLSTGVYSLVLFILSSLMWMAMVFVSALKAYLRIVGAFLLGFFLAIPASLIGGRYLGLDGFLIGLNLGLSLIVFMLALSITIEFKGSARPARSILGAHRRYWMLGAIGWLAALGIWADKMIFWFAQGQAVIGPLKIYPLYDGALFLAYLTALPAMAFFVMIVETDFYESYRRYFLLLEDKSSYSTLEEVRQDMVENLRENAVKLLIFQMILTTVIVFFSPWLVVVLRLDWWQWSLFRIACLGAFFHMTCSLLGIVLAYFDCRREWLGISLLFLIVQCSATFWTLSDFWLYGYGYLAAGLITAPVSLYLVLDRLKYLHYYTLAAPQMGGSSA